MLVDEFERYLRDHRDGKELDEANKEDLEAFAEWVKHNSKITPKMYMWALRYYFAYTSNKEMRGLASEIRQRGIRKKSFALRNFRGVNPEYVGRLAAVGVRSAEQMLKLGKTRVSRQRLSDKTGIPAEAILEFVKLADLSRIEGVKDIRARLYYDAGVDTVEKMSKWDPDKLRAYLTDFVTKTGFNGIAPLPKEVKSTVETAKRLPKIVEY